MRDCVFIGIDQTGAVDSKGKPKKLPAAVLSFKSQAWQIETFQLDGLGAETFKKFKNLRIIAIDSVFGLPHKVFPKGKTLRNLFKQAAQFEFSNKAYGLETAYQFFKTFLDVEHEAQFPVRECERIAKANSVFQKHPFQKNIGCGTFRIWKELGLSLDWYHIFPQDGDYADLKGKPVIMEGYPSLIWKNLIQSKSRDTETLLKYLKKNKIILLNPKINADTADAIVLSLAALEFFKDPRPHTTKFHETEGWILGLDHPAAGKSKT